MYLYYRKTLYVKTKTTHVKYGKVKPIYTLWEDGKDLDLVIFVIEASEAS
jgi:hypothetical protein